ncbi:MAG: 5'-nucleotidase C-terminal domain-containing protein [Chloroherpetonaceae bacterium]
MKKSRYSFFVMMVALLSVFFSDASAQVITIDSARALPRTSTQIFTVEGVITRARGRIVYMQDATAGIAVFRSVASFTDSVNTGILRSGDRIRVTGRRSDFNNLQQIAPTATVERLSRDNVVVPKRLTLAELAVDHERFEGQLLEIRNMSFVGASGNFTSNQTLRVTDPTGVIDTMFVSGIDAQPLVGQPIPTRPFTYEGVLSQFATPGTTVITTHGHQFAPIGAQNDFKQRFFLSVLHNNDGESRLVAAGTGQLANFGGVAHFKTVSDSLKRRANNTGNDFIMLSAGDNILAGTAFAASTNSGISFDGIALDSLNYDAIVLGNHDFDFGPDTLAKIINTVQNPPVPFISANLDFSNEPVLQNLVNQNRIAKSVVIQRRGERIGVIGATTERLAAISSPRNVIVNQVRPAVQAEAALLRSQGVNKIILVSHLQSVTEDSLLISQLTNADSIDVAIAGGGSEVLANPGTLLVPSDVIRGPYPTTFRNANNTPIPVITAQGDYRYVARLSVEFDGNGNVVSIDTANSGPVRVSRVAPDAVQPEPGLLQNVVTPVANFQAQLAATVLGVSQVALEGRRNPIRTRETNQGNLLADAHLAEARRLAPTFGLPLPAVALQNGGGIRNDNVIPAGNITAQNTFDIAPFLNFLTIVPNVPRAQFKEILENAYSRIANVDGRFAQIAGLRVVLGMDATLYPPRIQVDTTGIATPGRDGERVREAVILSQSGADSIVVIRNGQVVPGPGITVATIDFLVRPTTSNPNSAGGDGYPFRGLPFTTLGITYQAALQNHIVNNLAGNITAARYPEAGSGRIVQAQVVTSNSQTPAVGPSSTTTFTGTNFTFTANVTTAAPVNVNYLQEVVPTPVLPLPAGVAVVSRYYWQVSAPGIVFTNGKVSFPLSALAGVQNPSALRVLKRDNPTQPWQDLGGTIVSGNLESVTPFNSFSEFAIGSDISNSLPVELTAFSATSVREGVKLEWQTASEQNNDRFEIERSLDRTTFAVVGTVRGAGTTTEAQSYAFVDNTAQNGKFYYRLKQVDFDGTVNYSNIVEVVKEKPTTFELAQNYPNPFNPATTINYQLPTSALVTLKVYDVVGREVATLVNARQEAGRYDVRFNGSSLSSGVYFYRLQAGSFVETKKMMLVK